MARASSWTQVTDIINTMYMIVKVLETWENSIYSRERAIDTEQSTFYLVHLSLLVFKLWQFE